MNDKELTNFIEHYSPLVYSEFNMYLTEEDFMKNTKIVFGEECPFFGKMLYLYMARGYDRAKISWLRFLESLYPLFNPDNRQNYPKIVFSILDIDRDQCLNIVNLLHI